jgi:hypothetical protein
MKKKVCKTCGEAKPDTEFYRHPATADGMFSSCKVCVCEQRHWNPKAQEYDRRRAKTPQRRALGTFLKLAYAS